MLRCLIILSLALVSTLVVAQAPLLPLPQDGKWGFVDTAGQWAIAPRFAAVGAFDGDLAPAREGGQYGYIDRAGAYVIAPRFDYAKAFAGERAVAYEDSVAVVIDRAGAVVFELPGADVTLEAGGRIVRVARTRSVMGEADSVRLYDASGRQLFDGYVKDFRELGADRYVVSVLTGDREGFHARTPTVVIDVRGTIVWRQPSGCSHVDVGRYADGWAPITCEREEGGMRYGYLDDAGDVDWVSDFAEFRLAGYDWFEDLAGRATFTLEQDGRGFLLTPSGKTVALDTAYEIDEPLLGAVGYAKRRLDNWSYYKFDDLGRIDTSVAFKGLTEIRSYGSVVAPDIAYVLESALAGYGAVDQRGAFLPAPRIIIDSLHRWDIYLGDGALLWISGYDAFQHGWWDTRTATVVPPTFSHAEALAGAPGILRAARGDTVGYVDYAGHWIARAISPADALPTDIDYRYDRRPFVSTGIPAADSVGGLAIVPAPDSSTSTEVAFSLVNGRANSTVVFNVQDARLGVYSEASLDGGQTWRPITELSSSWCGNSYGYGLLAPRRAWPIAVPRFRGSTPALLRVAIWVRGSLPGDASREWDDPQYPILHPLSMPDEDWTVAEEAALEGQLGRWLYSPTYEGSVNPAQFWRKPDFTEQPLFGYR